MQDDDIFPSTLENFLARNLLQRVVDDLFDGNAQRASEKLDLPVDRLREELAGTRRVNRVALRAASRYVEQPHTFFADTLQRQLATEMIRRAQVVMTALLTRGIERVDVNLLTRQITARGTGEHAERHVVIEMLTNYSSPDALTLRTISAGVERIWLFCCEDPTQLSPALDSAVKSLTESSAPPSAPSKSPEPPAASPAPTVRTPREARLYAKLCLGAAAMHLGLNPYLLDVLESSPHKYEGSFRSLKARMETIYECSVGLPARENTTPKSVVQPVDLALTPKNARDRRGMTLVEAAAKLGLSPEYLCRMEENPSAHPQGLKNARGLMEALYGCKIALAEPVEALPCTAPVPPDKACELLAQLVASLPSCDHCERPATRAFQRGSGRYCDLQGLSRKMRDEFLFGEEEQE